jgi:hypothetical protein
MAELPKDKPLVSSVFLYLSFILVRGYVMSRYRHIKALFFHQGGFGIYDLLILLCLFFGFSLSSGAFSAAHGDTCAGLSAGGLYTWAMWTAMDKIGMGKLKTT